MQHVNTAQELEHLIAIRNSISHDEYLARLEAIVLLKNKDAGDASVHYLNAILNALPDMVVVCNVSGGICYVNSLTEKMFRNLKLFGNNIRVLFPQQSQAWVADLLEKSFVIDGFQTNGFIQLADSYDHLEVDICCRHIKADSGLLLCFSIRSINSLKQELNEIRQKESYLNETLEFAQIAYSELLPMAGMFKCSKEFCLLFEIPYLESMLLRRDEIYQRIYPDDRLKMHEFQNQTLSDDLTHRFEYRIVTNTQTIKYILCVAKRFVQPDRSIVVRAVHIDISNEKQRILELQQIENTIHKLNGNEKETVLILDSQLQCVYCSVLLFDILGIDAVGLYSKSFIQFLQESDVSLFYKLLDQNDLTVVSCDFQIFRADKSYSWIECRLFELNEDIHHLGSYTIVIKDVTEKYRASDFMQLASDIFNNVQTGFYIYKLEDYQNSASLRLIAANPTTEQLTGIAPQTIIGKFIDDVFPNLRAKNIPDLFMEVVHSGKAFEMTDFDYSDDSILQCVYSFKAFPLPNQQLGVSFEDITAQKKAQILLSESERRFKTYLEQSPTAIFILETNGYCAYVNPAANSLLNCAADELLGQMFNVILWDQSIDLFQLTQNSNTLERVQLKTKDGKKITVRLSLITLAENRWLAVCSDVTELEQARDDMQRIYDLSLSFICIVTTEGVLLRMNSAFEQLLGFSQQEMSVVPLETFIHPDDRVTSKAFISQQLAQGASPIKYVNRMLCKDGSYRWLAWSIERVTDENIVFAVAHDITEAKNTEYELTKAKERAEQSDKLKSAFLANMSHEIRTPMNGIVGFARLLNKDSLTQDQRTKYINIINKSSNQLLTIISDIIDISKIEAGLLQITEKEVALNDVFEEIYTQFLLEIKNAGKEHLSLKMLLDMNNASVCILTDEVRLKQIISNLLNNAIKFTNTGEVSFGYMIVNGSDLRLFVEDSGQGIPADQLQTVFERFVQIDHHENKAMGGTGLGLAISKGLVELFGGDIQVFSEINKGTRFEVNLPYKSAIQQDVILTDPQLSISAQTNWSGKTILLIDDMEVIHEFFNEVLLTTQVTLIRVKRGKDALTVFKNRHSEISLVLLDIQMPDINGVAVAQVLRSINPNVPIVAQTAFAQRGDKEEYLNAGFDDYLSKPINIEALMRILKLYLD